MNSVYKHVVEISAKINEEQDEIIMQTIQHIGGTEFREITIDRNKVIEALTDYMKKQENKADVAEVVRCKACQHAYINSFSAQSGVALCRFWTNRSQTETVVMQQDDFCSYGERKSNE